MPKTATDIRSLARQHTESAIRSLANIVAHSDSDSARVAAATALLDRGWGKPEQSIDVKDGRELRQYTDAELIAIIAAAAAEPALPALPPPTDKSELH